MPIVATPGLGNISGDWYAPHPSQYPNWYDEKQNKYVAAGPAVPLNSFYSPSRNQWFTPDGKLIDAGDYRPLPPDSNTVPAINHQIYQSRKNKGATEEKA